ncbi:MAG: hypothetical protein JETT_2254 [Candidatus Jettenia ecosi]|uniref:Uncharacterized protein n=1 Tax=Candidatus Jettenia ecosi TaxID=2494326 RepID=A0A533Q9T3_9BACT|nr:MAG: hypothetical protein JETT_2254 [Candidatus Jettenia ecosi]
MPSPNGKRLKDSLTKRKAVILDGLPLIFNPGSLREMIR